MGNMGNKSFLFGMFMMIFIFIVSLPTPPTTVGASTISKFGETIGFGLGTMLVGTVLGAVAWLPMRVFKGAKSAPDFRGFVLVGTATFVVFILWAQWGINAGG